MERAAERGCRVAALVDTGGLYGVPSFVRACRRAGITPVPGCALPVGGAEALFLAVSPAGYRSLCRMITRFRVETFLPPPGQGVVALLTAPEQALWLEESSPFYLMLDAAAPEAWNRALAASGLPVMAVARGDDPPTPAELAGRFSWCPPALESAAALEALCADPWPDGASRLPTLPGDLRALARAGLARRYGATAPYDQLERELRVIEGRGQAGYFLAIRDLVEFARRESIPIGPGRGSAVGSLTAYALGITAIDPMAHQLYFERFLNPERPDLPDIDLDVCSLGRPRLLEYLRRRHGPERVAHVGVMTTLGARGAIREAGRILALPREVVDGVAGALPHGSGLAEALTTLPEFTYIDITREPLRSLFAMARELEGRPWHPSVHAAGVVLSPEPLPDLVPLERTSGGDVITQYGSEDLEGLGLAKIDILGLRNLTVIAAASREASIDLEQIPLDDPATFRLLSRGESIGVFQLDSLGIRNLLQQVRPERINDLIALLSLYRPGPFEAGVVETYTRRRKGLEKTRHLHPALAPILDETYGVLLYQEQAMRIAHEIGGLPLAAADGLRRALARGGAGPYREGFIRGAVSRGLPGGVARRVFDLLERFSGYSFNKAHTAAYALLCYQTAYLKAHCPAHYFAALLAHESGYFGAEVYVREAARLGVKLLPAHVNRSAATYRVESPGAIRTGLLQIKGVGPATVSRILDGRAEGLFESVAALAARSRLGPQALEALEGAGALAGLPDRTRAGASPGQLTLFDMGLDQPAPPRPPAREAPSDSSWVDLGGRVRLVGPVITSRRRQGPAGRPGLTMLLQVGPDQVEVLVPPEVYARDLLAIDPAGVAVEGSLLRRGPSLRVVADAIRTAV